MTQVTHAPPPATASRPSGAPVPFPAGARAYSSHQHQQRAFLVCATACHPAIPSDTERVFQFGGRRPDAGESGEGEHAMVTSKQAVLEAEFGVEIEVTGSGRDWTARAAKDVTPIDEATGTSRAQALEVLGSGLAAWSINAHPTLAEVAHPTCQCGCGGSPRNPKIGYLPGHDARHASALRRQAAVVIEQLPPDVTPDGTIREVVRAHGTNHRRVNAQGRPSGAARERTAEDGTSRFDGSEAAARGGAR